MILPMDSTYAQEAAQMSIQQDMSVADAASRLNTLGMEVGLTRSLFSNTIFRYPSLYGWSGASTGSSLFSTDAPQPLADSPSQEDRTCGSPDTLKSARTAFGPVPRGTCAVPSPDDFKLARSEQPCFVTYRTGAARPATPPIAADALLGPLSQTSARRAPTASAALFVSTATRGTAGQEPEGTSNVR